MNKRDLPVNTQYMNSLHMAQLLFPSTHTRVRGASWGASSQSKLLEYFLISYVRVGSGTRFLDRSLW